MEESVAISVVGGGEELAGARGVGAFLLSEEGEGHTADPGEVLAGKAALAAGAVLVEDDVEDPVLMVLDRPVPSRGLAEGLGVLLAAADVIGRLGRLLAFLLALAGHLHDGAEVLPFVLGREPLRRVDHPVGPLFFPAAG